MKIRSVILLVIAVLSYSLLSAQDVVFNLNWEKEKAILTANLPTKKLDKLFFEKGCNFNLTPALCAKDFIKANMSFELGKSELEIVFLSITQENDRHILRFLVYDLPSTNAKLSICNQTFFDIFPDASAIMNFSTNDTAFQISFNKQMATHIVSY